MGRCPCRPRQMATMKLPTAVFLLMLVGPACAPAMAATTQPPAIQAPRAQSTPAPLTFEQLQAAIDKLGAANYADRAAASKIVRRAPQAQAVAALIQAVTGHTDGFVRFRALVLLTGFPDPRVKDLMTQFLADPNDRLRQVAYRYFEYNPDPAMEATLLAALGKESAEFVRPALVRALAALGTQRPVQAALLKEMGRGDTVFRGAVIEALGDHRAVYARDALIAATKLEDALAEDAALALGKLQDKTVVPVLAAMQQSASPNAQPLVAAAICLLGVNCSSHLGYLERVLGFAEKTPGYQRLVRGAATGLGAIAASGNDEALGLLIETGAPSRDPIRAPIALAVGTVALRNPAFLLRALEPRADRDAAIGLLVEAFDMLEEDYEKERFFATARRTYWQAPEGSRTRAFVQALFDKLDF